MPQIINGALQSKYQKDFDKRLGRITDFIVKRKGMPMF